MDIWYGLLFIIWVGLTSLMSTLEESLVANSSSTKVWVMDPSLFDVYNGMSFKYKWIYLKR
jgi:hypothetical protein